MSDLENAPTVGLEDQQRQEAQAWIDQRGGLVYVVNLFKDLASEAANTRNFVLRTQQELAACRNDLGVYRNLLILNSINLKSGEKQGGRKKRTKKKKQKRRKKHRRKTRRKSRRKRTHKR